MGKPTLERISPDGCAPCEATGTESFLLHVERYQFAARYARPGRLLDLGCGTGYGCDIIARTRSDIEKVVGIDLDEEAVAYAKEHYGGERIRFMQGDAMTFFDSEGYDTIVSVETIEHVAEPLAFVAAAIKNLRPGGIFVASAPITPSVDVNVYHRHDFSEYAFRELFLGHGFTEVARLRQVQAYNPIRILLRREKRVTDIRRNLALFYLHQPRALLRRLRSVIIDGFHNKYLTIAWVAQPQQQREEGK